MARVNGITCDVCKTFAEVVNANSVPAGWITVEIKTANDTAPGRFELCGNKCLRDLSKARYNADREASGEATTRTITDEGRAQMRANGLRLAHDRGAHDAEPHSECPACIKATEPAR